MPRQLDIGPDMKPLAGFEVLDVMGPGRPHPAEILRRLPYEDASFDLIHMAHVLEHVAWYQTGEALAEMLRVLRPGGVLEVWVPDALSIAEAFVNAERRGHDPLKIDPWTRFNPAGDPCVWAAGRLFSYGDGTGTPGHPGWHLAMFSPRRLREALLQAGFVGVEELHSGRVRGHNHGWISLGATGRRKP